MFERLRDGLRSEKPDDYCGTEMLAQGSSYETIRGAVTQEQTRHLQELVPLILDELYEDLEATT